ncbi:ATP-dependent RNA helicase HrpA [Hydrogenophaga electricum]|uniref:ATP-dependent helicase n=1 Tax=Hydrogenophaga electricum TaxID=1230953 RepID=A0ABQ6BY84_9BURK|nr:ATP-dependent RNA helicase HrpA [Hydrogenophaga electricum]GLS12864.1 ATP-dependent helicase [Hydrogenophaga electricum]
MSSAPLTIEFPESLPVSARRQEIEAAIRDHQVVIVCGETGSGKTTQLPKIALAMGRGRLHAKPGQRGQLIGHTQPRRIAASSVAKRIAEELKTPLGEVVGYKVRFQDRLSRDASVKLMTDGILLAETQTDPDLKAYDTLIIDEAHERSLNIDFLLGYLRQLLPRRPDLKVIVTSATIDADRFADYFSSAKGKAPVLMVSGRTFPVEVRYRPFEESREYDLNNAIADGVDELWRGGAGSGGDILVFLPGEREIREAADHLRKHLAHQPALRNAEVLPLFARLSQAEQDRIFQPHGQRRIVLSTNVAETSLTVPGIRFVIDAGTARVKRYSFRQKVEQLLIEPISQAAANQRAGRCGRVADGICIRLYDEADFNGRPRFTDPEILRSSLAGVILRMKALHLGAVEDFAFLEAPQRRAITDGYQLLAELGAVNEGNELTPVGRTLSKLPLDPRVGRILLEARERGALDEVLVIASALSLQDVRDRPLDKQTQADQAHKKFDDEKSEFTGTLKLWKWLTDSKGGDGHEHKLSHRQYENLLRENYLNVRRVREWRDIHSQLHTVVAEQGWKLHTPPARPAPGRPKPGDAPSGGSAPRSGGAWGQTPASYEQLHLSMLAGLLGNIGCKNDTEDWYLGARGIKFHRHPGANLSKKPGRWIVCAELVETARLFGRGIANIEPQWLEQVGGHLLKKQVLDPHWEKKAGRVSAYERATLYGLVVYQQRRVDYSKVDPAGARELFIREALVGHLHDDTWDSKLPFLAANRRTVREVQELEHKARRQDVLVDDELIYAFYEAQVPADIANGAAFERWWRDHSRENPKLLFLTREELMRHEAAGITTQAYPRTLRLGGVDCAAAYLHQPGDPRDGVSVTVPIFALNQVSEDRCDWLVPGMLKDKVQALLKTLHQRPRSRLVPLPATAEKMTEALCQPEVFGHGSLMDALLKLVREATQLPVQRNDIKVDMLPAHHFMHLRVVDEHGRQLGQGRNLGALKAELGSQARGAFQALAQLKLQDMAATAAAPVSPEPPPAQAEGRRRVPASDATKGGNKAPVSASPSGPATVAEQRHTAWDFGELPELMEIRKGGQTLIGFPALIDDGDAVRIEVFDEPEVAQARHRAGLRRLFALQIKDALKYLEKNLPGLQAMGVAYMNVGKTDSGGAKGGDGGTLDELKHQILDLALDRAFLTDPLPADAAAFKARIDEGRGRLTLIANEIARQTGTILAEFAAAQRKLKDSKPPADVAADVQQQLQRLVPKTFLSATPYAQLQHFPRYLKAVQLRLDKLRGDPARDAAKFAELRPQDQRFWRLVAERKGVQDARLQEVRWLLEELRVSFFAQELRTPQPVSIKRLEKAWGQLTN